jgi:hypothetical protein
MEHAAMQPRSTISSGRRKAWDDMVRSLSAQVARHRAQSRPAADIRLVTHCLEGRLADGMCAMSGKGVIFKRCGCRDPRTRRRLESGCTRLAERGHGSWYFHCSVTTLWGRRERIRRGGYPSRNAAEVARGELLEQSRQECTVQAWTVARWLR